MLILTIRTDSPKTELGLFDDKTKLLLESYQTGRELAESLNQKIIDLLNKQNRKLSELNGIVGYLGPGSFTGLRIGLSTASALAYGLSIPIVGTNQEDWIDEGIKQLVSGTNRKMIMPFYGSEPHVTMPKK